MKINEIVEAIKSNQIRITDHAVEEAYADQLTFDEIYSSIINGEVIKDYPKDRPYPSCLVYGKSSKGNPIHSVWGYNVNNQWAVLITVYRPDPKLWLKSRKRRKK